MSRSVTLITSTTQIQGLQVSSALPVLEPFACTHSLSTSGLPKEVDFPVKSVFIHLFIDLNKCVYS